VVTNQPSNTTIGGIRAAQCQRSQNLPGNWESRKFNLPASLVEAIPHIGSMTRLLPYATTV